MIRLMWSASFELGIKSIDDQHKNLFALAKAVPLGLAARSSTEIATFVQAAREHFESEESILLLSGFPELHEHRHYHLSLIRRAGDLTTICDSEENPIKSGEFHDEIISFLLDDIVRGDTAFKSFLQYHGLTENGW